MMQYGLCLEVLFLVNWYRKYSTVNSPVATPRLIISVEPGSVVAAGMFLEWCCLQPHTKIELSGGTAEQYPGSGSVQRGNT